MTSIPVMDTSAMSALPVSRRTFSSVAPLWILANVLPPILLVVAAWAYLNVNGESLADVINAGAVGRLAHPVWFAIGTAGLYLVASVGLRGAVLRPLVPRFTILGWVAAALVSAVVMLVLTATGSLIGLLVAKGLELSTQADIPVPTGLNLIPFVIGIILGSEIMGLILGGLPGLLLAAGEALVVGRPIRSVWNWILWTAAAWSTVTTIIMLHAFLVVFHRTVSPDILRALAVAIPVVLGIATGLVTLPAVARLVSRQNSAS